MERNDIYRRFCDSLKINPEKVKSINQIPFLPIEFFKSYEITSAKYQVLSIKMERKSSQDGRKNISEFRNNSEKFKANIL